MHDVLRQSEAFLERNFIICVDGLLLVIIYTHWSGKSYLECDEQIIRHLVLTTLTIWLTDRWSSVRVKLTLTDGQGFLQRVSG